MTEHELTYHGIKRAFCEEDYQKSKVPLVLMITATKPVFVDDELKKYRVMLTDGTYSTHGLIDEPCIPYVTNNKLAKYCIIKITEYSSFCTQKHMLLIKDMSILKDNLEKPTNESISIDTYLEEHPEQDYMALNKEARGSFLDPKKDDSATPATRTHQPQQQNSVQQKYPAGNPAASKQERVTTIDSLSPYQNTWKIRARVSFKGDLKQWRNNRGEGKLFSVNFLDETDEIRATAFNEVAEKLYSMLQEGKVYYISKGRIQASKKPFNTLAHAYELSLDRDTVVEECFDTAAVPTINFSFTGLDKIQNLETNAIIDVIGVLKTVNPAFQITAKSTGKAFDRRNIVIVDQSGFEIELGLWNKTAVDFDTPEGTVAAFKACKVQDFNGRSLSLTQTGTMVVNPDTTECFKLKGWFDNGGINESFKSLKVEAGSRLNTRKTVVEVEEENLGQSDKPDYFSMKGTIAFVKGENFCYPACANIRDDSATQSNGRAPLTCNKKLIETDGGWRCERCDIVVPEPTHRYILSCSAMDSTGQIWISFFDQEAKKLLGIDATELVHIQQAELMGEEVPVSFKDIIKRPLFHDYVFRIRAKAESFNDVNRVRYNAQSVDSVDYGQEILHLADELSAIYDK